MQPTASAEPASVSANLLSYLGVLARRRWIMLPALIITPVVAVALELQKPARYEATADLFLNANIAAAIAGIDEPTVSDVARAAETQARLARVPQVARRAVAAAKTPQRNAYDLLGASSVSSDPDADVLHFTVRDADPALAQRLATTYAEQFPAFRTGFYVAANNKRLKSIQGQLNRLRAEGAATSSFYAELVGKKQQLETFNTVLSADPSLIRPADSAFQISPRPALRTGLLGLGFGIALAIALAFLAEALDTRIKTIDELESNLDGLPMLGRLPKPLKGGDADPLAMLSDPVGRYGESIRMLRVRVDLAIAERRHCVLMVTSATPQEGKSTTVANLAVAFAQAGRRVVLCDLDARRPMIQSLFRLPPQPGLTDVATGAARLEDVLTRVPIPEKPYWRRNDLRNGRRRGGLEVLTVGGIPKDAGELVGSEGLVEILERLRARADLVLLDTPAMLAVGDAMTVAGVADAVIGVARLGVVRRSKLRELAQALAASPAAPLGFVATGSLLGDRYGLDWYYHHPAVLAEQRESIQR